LGNEKAKWGLDILYTKEMKSFVTPLLEQSNQTILVIKLTIIIINVYLPSSSLPQKEYDDSLNFLAATLSNHEVETAIFVMGDFPDTRNKSNSLIPWVQSVML
jgi:exonuclease III